MSKRQKIRVENSGSTITFELDKGSTVRFLQSVNSCISDPKKVPTVSVGSTMLGSAYLSNSVIIAENIEEQ